MAALISMFLSSSLWSKTNSDIILDNRLPQQSSGLLRFYFRISGDQKEKPSVRMAFLFGDPPEIRTPDTLLKRDWCTDWASPNREPTEPAVENTEFVGLLLQLVRLPDFKVSSPAYLFLS